MVDVEVAIDKLRAAGSDFKDMGDKLGSAKQVADQLELSSTEMSYLGEIQGIVTAYEEVRSYVVGLLQDGDEALHDVGTAVEKAADSYQSDEEAGVHDSEQIDVS